jgi:hypothetical protein
MKKGPSQAFPGKALFLAGKEVAAVDLSSVDDLEFFEQISRSRSLTDAARSWGKSLPTVSKRLTQLAVQSTIGLGPLTGNHYVSVHR